MDENVRAALGGTKLRTSASYIYLKKEEAPAGRATKKKKQEWIHVATSAGLHVESEGKDSKMVIHVLPYFNTGQLNITPMRVLGMLIWRGATQKNIITPSDINRFFVLPVSLPDGKTPYHIFFWKTDGVS
jgi:hypothetical protein